MSSNGTWADVIYDDHTNAVWKTMLHPDRILSMIRSYHCISCGGNLYQDALTLVKIHLGLEWWFKANPKCDNYEFLIQNEELCIKNEELCIKNDEFVRPPQWWWADIGQPDVPTPPGNT